MTDQGYQKQCSTWVEIKWQLACKELQKNKIKSVALFPSVLLSYLIFLHFSDLSKSSGSNRIHNGKEVQGREQIKTRALEKT